MGLPPLSPPLSPPPPLPAPPLPPPANLEAEQALLGAALFDVEAFHAAAAVRPEQFFEPLHGRLWQAIGELARDDRRADPVLVAGRFQGDGAFAALGGLGYLLDLVDRAPPPDRAADYAAALADLAARRAMMALAHDLARQAADAARGSALSVAAEAEAALGEIASAGAVRASWESAGGVVSGAIAASRGRRGVAFPTGLAALDRMTGGLSPGEMAVIAGRPGMGKSAAGLTIARANAAAGRGVLVFSLEMSAEIVGLRLACDVAADPDAFAWRGPDGRFTGETPTLERARRNALTADQWAAMEAAQRVVDGWPLEIDTRPGLTVPVMEACARRRLRDWARRGVPPGPVIVDHLGIVRPDKGRGGNKVVETGDISRALSEMAKRLQVPVVALVQVNRQNESRDDKRPTLADLRWSGAIEEDARLVIFLHRPAYYARSTERRPGEDPIARTEREIEGRDDRRLFWIVAKQNSGPTGQVEAWCDIARSAIRDKPGEGAGMGPAAGPATGPREAGQSPAGGWSRGLGQGLGLGSGQDSRQGPGQDSGQGSGRDSGRGSGEGSGQASGQGSGQGSEQASGQDAGQDAGQDPGRRWDQERQPQRARA